MEINRFNNKYTATLGLLGGAGGVIFSIMRKTGFWKGVGNYLVFTLAGSLLGMAIYAVQDKELKANTTEKK
jgi:1,4-dihydroxy-2-naphthoate octaprenyltransferase